LAIVFKFLADSTITRCRAFEHRYGAQKRSLARSRILRGEDLRRMPVIEQLELSRELVAIVCKGRVTKADYDAVLVPAVRDASKT
jgi:hypothetical protein